MSTPILNNAQVRDFTFEAVRTLRPALAKKMTRVSENFYNHLEYRLRIRIHADVQALARSDLKTLRTDGAESRDPALPWLINQSQMHQFAIAAMQGTDLTQVAGSYAHSCDTYLRSLINARISSMPSVGKTIQ